MKCFILFNHCWLPSKLAKNWISVVWYNSMVWLVTLVKAWSVAREHLTSQLWHLVLYHLLWVVCLCREWRESGGREQGSHCQEGSVHSLHNLLQQVSDMQASGAPGWLSLLPRWASLKWPLVVFSSSDVYNYLCCESLLVFTWVWLGVWTNHILTTSLFVDWLKISHNM